MWDEVEGGGGGGGERHSFEERRVVRAGGGRVGGTGIGENVREGEDRIKITK